VLSTTGNNMGGAIAGSRTLFAMADQGDLPGWLARVHAVYRTPVSAIYVTSAAAFVLALSGTYAQMAQASAVSRLVVYVAACAATLRLRHARFASHVAPAQFVTPLGPVIPLAAILVSLAILAGASGLQLTSGVVALAVGAVLYVITVRSRV
jgi:amino acid transporter